MTVVRVLEGAGFVVVAVALHLALFWEPRNGVVSGAGAGGSDQVSLTGMTPHIAAMLDAVDAAPEVSQTTPAAVAPTLPQSQPTPLAPTAPPVQTAPPALPQIETPGLALPRLTPPPPPPVVAPPAPPVLPTPTVQPETPSRPPVAPPDPPRPTVTAAPAPQPRPDRPRAPARSPAPGQKETRAAGTGGGTVAGNAGLGDTIGGTDAKTQDLLRTWFTRIAQQVQRTQGRSLRAIPTQGVATVRLTVRTDGRLESVVLITSSGQEAVDREVLTAVRQAGQFPKAPQSLGSGLHSYNIPFRVGK